jgi:hypothetical protein
MAVTFIASDLIALQVKFAEESKELSDRVHGVFAAPGINYFGSVAVAEGQHRLVTGSGEIAEGNRPAGNVFGRILDQSSDMLERDHRVTFIVEPLGAVLDPEDVVFEVLAIGFDNGWVHMRTQGRGNAKHLPEMRFGGADLIETAERCAGAGHEEAKLRGTAFERIEDLVTD